MGDTNKILEKLNSLYKLIEPYGGSSTQDNKKYVEDLITSLLHDGQRKLTWEEMIKLNTIFSEYKDENTTIDKKTGLVKKKFTRNPEEKDSLRDIAVVFTGFRDKHFEQEIVKHGGAVYGSISGNVTHLICKDAGANTVKMKKARSLGIKILDVKTFDEFITFK